MSRNQKRWTNEEVEIIKLNYNESYEYIQSLLPDRTIKSIKHKIVNLGLPREKAFYLFTNEEDEILKNNNMESQEFLMSLLPNRDWNSIIHRMLRLGLDRQKAWRFWTEYEESILKNAKTIEEVVEKLPDRTESQIYQKAKSMGVLYSDRWWTNEQISKLKELYPYNPCEKVADIIGRTMASVYTKANELGLKNFLKSPPIDENLVIKMYVEDKLEIKEIASKFNIGRAKISKIIPFNLKRRYRSLDKEEIISRYLNGESCLSISVDYKVSSPTIKNLLIDNKIELRNPSEYNMIDLPIREIIDLYNYGFSAVNIGEFYEVTGSTIMKRLVANGIEIRDHSFYVSGRKSNKWKGGLTPENSRIRSSKDYQAWRKIVMERDNYTCQCCGDNTGGNLHVHHINNFSDYEELRMEVTNGITLCEDCHSPNIKGSFHNLYGTSDNDILQLQEYFDEVRTDLELPLIDIENDIIFKDYIIEDKIS